MSYITRDDFHQIIRDVFVDAIIDEDDTIFLQAVESAVSQVRSYLFGRYDVDTIFAQTGTNRHSYLVRIVCYVTRYILNDRIPKRDTGAATKAEKDYTDSIAYLKLVMKGDVEMELPRKPNADTTPITQFRSSAGVPRSGINDYTGL
jgi:phage gp36-like protein